MRICVEEAEPEDFEMGSMMNRREPGRFSKQQQYIRKSSSALRPALRAACSSWCHTSDADNNAGKLVGRDILSVYFHTFAQVMKCYINVLI
jgi:hypothetical protein